MTPRLRSLLFLFLTFLILLDCRPALASPSTHMAGAFNSTAMASLSPLLTLSAMGMKERLKTPGDKPLPFHARTQFLGFAVALLMVLLLKDTLGEIFPLAKKPLDALDVIQNKVFAVACAAALLPKVAASMKGAVSLGMVAAWHVAGPAIAYASPDAAQSVPAWIDTASWWVSYAIGAASFFSIWCASHIVNVLGLLAPVPFVGPLLKVLRLALLGALASADAIHPMLGLMLSLLILFIAFRMTGWATRLMLFGTISGLDIFFRKWRTPRAETSVLAFTSAGLAGMPKRVIGRLSVAAGKLLFTYHPLFLGPLRTKSMEIPQGLGVAKGLACPSVTAGKGKTLFLLAPRYRGHEKSVALLLGCDITPSAIGRGVRAAWCWIKGFRHSLAA